MKPLLVALILAFGSVGPLWAKPCEHLLPGIERMSRGVDITTLDLFPSDLLLTSGFRQSLFDFTCESESKWTHPSFPNVQYPIPDQIAAVNTLPGGALNDRIEFHDQVDSYKKSLSVQVGLDITTGTYGDYSLSNGFKRVQDKILNSNQTIADVSAYVSAVQMDFKPYFDMTPNKDFKHFTTSILPAKYENSPEKYQEFLDTYGTHYFESGIFGGFLLQQTIIEDDYRYKTTDKDIAARIKAGYLAMVNVKLNVEDSTNIKSTNFNQYTRTNHYYYGGQTNLVEKMNAEQFNQWSSSVPKDPWLFGGRLKPIENLIMNENIKAQVKTAVYVKKTRAYLQELKQTLLLIKRLVPRTESELNRIAELSKNVIPKESEIEEIAHKVQELSADAQAAKDRNYLERYSAQLNQVLHYELYCKKQVVDRCDHEKAREVNDAIAEASHLESQMKSMLKQTGRPDTEIVRSYISQASSLLHKEQNTPLGQCREKLFCNICKDVVVDIVKKNPCETTHIKSLLQVHL